MGDVRQPLRLAVVIPRYAPVFGGAENQCRLLNRHLLQSGLVSIVSLVTWRMRSTLPSREVIDDIPVRRLGAASTGRWGSYYFCVVAGAYLVARWRRYDVIHCHATSLLGFVVALVGWLTRRPVVLKLSTNGELLPSPDGRDALAGLRRLIAAFTVRSAYMIALNTQGLEELRAAGARRATIIPNGVDTSVFRPAQPEEYERRRVDLGVPRAAVVFLFSGRFVQRKGLDVLLSAFERLQLRYAADALRLVLVGSGEAQPDSVAGILAAPRLGVELRRSVLVHPPTDDVRQYLFASDVLVMPSRREGLPNAVLEAIACGLVCLLSDIPPHRELTKQSPGHPVRFFAPNDADALAAGLDECYRMVVAAREAKRVRSSGLAPMFRMEAVATRYLELLRSVDVTPPRA